jgi:hypothetical protein
MQVTAELLKSLHGCVKATVVEHDPTGLVVSEDVHVHGVSSIGWMPGEELQVVYDAELRGQDYVVEFRKSPHEDVFRAYLRRPFREGSSLVVLFKMIMFTSWTYQLQYGEA